MPRLFTPPARELTPATTRGFEAIAFAELIGIDLLPWQKWLFLHALELNESGAFRFRTVLVLVARQNGKTLWCQVLSLWRLFIDRAELVLGTAQKLDLAEEVWAGAVDMAESIPDLAEEIETVERAAGKKALRLKPERENPHARRRRYKVQAANRRGGRGLSGDLVILDELREHQTWDAWAAVSKTTMARESPQIVCLSNAGDSMSVVLNEIRAKALVALEGRGDTSVGIFEWSAPDGCDLDDWQAIAQANPSLGHRVHPDGILGALETDRDAVFRTEVLCQRVDKLSQSMLPLWPELLDPTSTVNVGARVAFGVDVSWDRATATIAVAALSDDDTFHVEVVAQGEGTGWVARWLAERVPVWNPVAVAVQGTGAPVSSIADDIEAAVGSPVMSRVDGQQLGAACAGMFDATSARLLSHTGQPQLLDAARFAATRQVGDAWYFDRRKSPVDIAPLMAVTVALHALRTFRQPEKSRKTGAVYAW